MPRAVQIARRTWTRLLGCVSGSPRWSATCAAPVDASHLSGPEERPSACDLLTRRERTPLALASCAGSRFRETDHEFVRSNECELEAGYQRWHNRQRQIRAKYRLGERLRPCPGCTACLVCVACENNNCRRKHLPVQYCAGDGVLPPMRR